MVLLVAIVTGAQAQNPTYKSDFTDGQIIWTTSSNVDAAITAGWMKMNSTLSKKDLKGKKLIDPTTNEEASSAQYSNTEYFYVQKTFNSKASSDKSLYLYVSGLTKMTIYFYQNSDGGGRTMEAYNGEGSDATKLAGADVIDDGRCGYFDVTLDGEDNIIRLNATNELLLYAIKVEKAPAGPSITDQTIADANYMQGQTTGVAALSVTAQASDANNSLEYQWYSNTTNSTEGGTAIATGTSYTPDVSAKGVTYYYCVVTEKDGDSQVVGDPVASNIAKITVSAAEAPKISVSGAPAEAVKVGANVVLTATATGTPTPTITWYNGNDESVATIEGTQLAYTVPTTTADTYTFYAKASNGVEPDATSAIQTIVVKEQVATPTISPNGAYFEESQDVELSATEGATILYSTDNGATWKTYNDELTLTATTTIKVKATKNGMIDSEEATATFKKVTFLKQTEVTGETTWDWSNLTGSSAEQSANTIPTNAEEFVLANMNGEVYDSNIGYTAETFNAQALKVICQFAKRASGGYFQGNKINFVTTVPGKVEVWFSNTSNRSDTQGNRRFIYVNEANTNVYSLNQTFVKAEATVNAGSVTINAYTGEENPTMFRVNKIVFTPLPTIDLTINAAAGATTVYSDYALDFSTLTNVKAYIETGTGDKLSWTQVTSAPAKTGLLVVSSATKLTVPTAASSETDVTDNRLKGVATGESKDVTADDNIYIFTLHDGKPGFIKSNTGRSLAVGKAYLDLGKATGAREFFELFEDGTTTGISSIDNDQLTTDNDAPAYNLAGQKVGKGYKGIVIINGKKVVK